MNNFMLFFEIILSTIVIVSVLLQDGKADALSGLIQGNKTESFYSKNKGKTKKSILLNITWFSMFLLMVNTLLLNIIKK